MLLAQTNLANTYGYVGRLEEALRLQRNVYYGYVKLNGGEHGDTLIAANNCANTLFGLKRYKEAKSLLRRMTPVARRVLGENHHLTLRMRRVYAQLLYNVDGATLADLREAVNTLEETNRSARRVLGGAHPLTEDTEDELRDARAALRAREAPLKGRAEFHK